MQTRSMPMHPARIFTFFRIRLLHSVISLFAVLNALHAQPRLYNPGIDVLHYRFALAVSDSSNILRGNASVTLRFLQNSSSVYLDLISNREGRGMTVTAVTLAGHSIPFTHRNDSLLITCVGVKDEIKELSIQYYGVPADGLIYSTSKDNRRTMFGDNWPNRGRNWLPCKDHLSDKATVEFIVTAPAHYKVVANGLLQSEHSLPGNFKRTHWKENVPIPTKVMVIGCADFAVSEPVMVDGIPVTSWIFPEQRDAGFRDYAPAADILAWFNKKLGMYAYTKLANVQSNTIFGGMENAGCIFYAESSVTGDKSMKGLLAHEIAHQWFGDAVTEKDWPHIWLSEGFATIMSQQYLEHVYGHDTAVAMLSKNRKEVLAFTRKQKVPVVDTTQGKDIMKLLNTNSYQKGGWVLHMLKSAMGDTAFWKAIRTYYARFKNRNASSADLQAVVEEVTGKSWATFFNQWLYIPENPSLSIKWQYDERQKEIVFSVSQKTNHIFAVPLELVVKDAEGHRETHTINISKQEQTVRFPARVKPVLVQSDPFCRLLFEEL